MERGRREANIVPRRGELHGLSYQLWLGPPLAPPGISGFFKRFCYDRSFVPGIRRVLDSTQPDRLGTKSNHSGLLRLQLSKTTVSVAPPCPFVCVWNTGPVIPAERCPFLTLSRSAFLEVFLSLPSPPWSLRLGCHRNGTPVAVTKPIYYT